MTVVRSEWGINGVRRLRSAVAVLIVVDVLSFSTAVDIATGRGAEVLPFPSGDRSAAQAAADKVGATLAAPRRAGGGQLSLSPRTLAQLAEGARIMLPSPNGSHISVEASSETVLAGCFRNAGAVSRAALSLAAGRDIGVIPAGERWPDGSLRPAVEDILGAGAIIHSLNCPLDAEARVARDCYLAARSDLHQIIRSCVSGQELITEGYEEDVDLALQFDESAHAPLMRGGAYVRFQHS